MMFGTLRMNSAPVLGYEKDAGSRTTIRLMYPEGAPFLKQEYQKTDIIALVVFKRLDLEWLTSVLTKKSLVGKSLLLLHGCTVQKKKKILNFICLFRAGGLNCGFGGTW